MNKYEVTIGGEKYVVESKEPLTDSQAYEYASQQAGQKTISDAVTQKEKNYPRVPYNPKAEVLRGFLGQGVMMGFGDEAEAALRTMSTKGADYEKLRDQLRAQQASFKSDFPAISPAANIGGSIYPALVTKTPPTMLGTVAQGAGLGAAQQVGEAENIKSAVEDVAKGGLVGGIASGATGLVGRAISPILQPGARDLMREGVRMTPGSALGGATQTFEQAAESVPVLGNLVKGARGQAIKDFDQAVLNRALKPLGKDLKSLGVSKDATIREAFKAVDSEISSAYNTLYPKLKLEMKPSLDRQLTALENRFSRGQLDDAGQAQLKSQIEYIRNQLSKGPISGSRVKGLKEDLADMALQYRQARGAEGTLGEAFSTLNDSIRLSLQNQNRGFAAELRKADEAFANKVRAEYAMNTAKGSEGIFSPAQLSMGVARADKTKRKGATARGDALMADLAMQGVDVLGQKIPDSGTAGRLAIMGALSGGAGAIDPTYMLPSLIGSSLYSNTGMSAFNKLLSAQRPKAVTKAGELLQRGSPFVALPASGLLE